MNHPKGHKLENLVLVQESNISLRRKGVAAPVYYFFHGELPYVEFFSSRSYVGVTEEGPEENILILHKRWLARGLQ